MITEKKFIITSCSKGELAKAYNVRTPILRQWLTKNVKLWNALQYDNGNILTPDQVRKIVNHLGEPETFFTD